MNIIIALLVMFGGPADSKPPIPARCGLAQTAWFTDKPSTYSWQVLLPKREITSQREWRNPDRAQAALDRYLARHPRIQCAAISVQGAPK